MRRYILLLVILISISNSFSEKSKMKLIYGASVAYSFDSNIGQNINETNAHYVVPKLNIKLKNIAATPIFAKVNIVYDAYQEKRVPTLNSPFLTVGTGLNLGNRKFSYDPEFSALLYVGMNVHVDDDPAGEIKNFVPAKRSLRLRNDISLELKRNKLEINNYIRRNDLGESKDANGDIIDSLSEDEWRVEFKPKYTRDFKVFKKDKIKPTELYAELEYEGNFSGKVTESYNMFGISTGLEIKLFFMEFDISGRLAQKNFTSNIEHPQEPNVLIKPVNKYAYFISSLEIPIVSDLEFEIGGKLRFKGSNNPSYDYDRHTFYAELKWNSKLEKKR